MHCLQAKRSSAHLPEPYNANKLSSFVELVLVIDQEIYKSMNENVDKVHKYCKDIANIINAVSAVQSHQTKSFEDRISSKKRNTILMLFLFPVVLAVEHFHCFGRRRDLDGAK